MGSVDFWVTMFVMFFIFTYENASSILVAGFFCWFLGRVGSVNAAIPRFLPQILHACAAMLFTVVSTGFTFFFLFRGGWLVGTVAGICTCLSVRNLWYIPLVPRRICVEEEFFEEPSSAQKEASSESEDRLS